MSSGPDDSGRVGALLREDPDAFDALRDLTADTLDVDPGAIEKDWTTEVLRSATAPLSGVDEFVFKGGTSLSKAYGIIERFSEDIDVLVVCQQTGQPLKRLLRTVAERASEDLGVALEREHEGRGYLNTRYSYAARRSVGFLTPGVLLEMGSPGGPWPSERLPVRSLMSQVAGDTDPAAVDDYSDLGVFQVTVLAPERTLAEKLAFLHHRATVADHTALRNGARHLHDTAMLLLYATARLAFDAWNEPSIAHSASLDPRAFYHSDEVWEHEPRFIDLDWLMGGEPGRPRTLYLSAPSTEFDRLAPVFGGMLGDLREQIHSWDIVGRKLTAPR